MNEVNCTEQGCGNSATPRSYRCDYHMNQLNNQYNVARISLDAARDNETAMRKQLHELKMQMQPLLARTAEAESRAKTLEALLADSNFGALKAAALNAQRVTDVKTREHGELKRLLEQFIRWGNSRPKIMGTDAHLRELYADVNYVVSIDGAIVRAAEAFAAYATDENREALFDLIEQKREQE